MTRLCRYTHATAIKMLHTACVFVSIAVVANKPVAEVLILAYFVVQQVVHQVVQKVVHQVVHQLVVSQKSRLYLSDVSDLILSKYLYVVYNRYFDIPANNTPHSDNHHIKIRCVE